MLVSNTEMGKSELHGLLLRQACAVTTGEVSAWVCVAQTCFRDMDGDDITVSQNKRLDAFDSTVAGELKEQANSASKAGPETGRLGFTSGRSGNTGLVLDNPETLLADTIMVADDSVKLDEPVDKGRKVPEGMVGNTIFTVEGICPWEGDDDIKKLTGVESDAEQFDQGSGA